MRVISKVYASVWQINAYNPISMRPFSGSMRLNQQSMWLPYKIVAYNNRIKNIKCIVKY